MQIRKEINPHFNEFVFNWDYETYFLFGGYGSSKSYHVGLKIVLKCLAEERKVLVVRQVYDTLRESTYDLLIDIISDMRLDNVVSYTTSPLKIMFPNGSEIIFKGMDKPEKLKSIHNVSIVWVEEASEISEIGFTELLGRARHPYKSIHFILTTNPVAKNNWTYRLFFKDETDVNNPRIVLDDREVYENRIVVKNNVYYHHSTAEDNLFLPKSYLDRLDEMKEYDPDLYRIARLGEFGLVGTKVLPQAKVMEHEEVLNRIGNIPQRFYSTGMDFGFMDSYNAVVRVAIDDKNKDLYVYWEYYKNRMTDTETIQDNEFQTLKESQELIIADSAEPKTIRFYNQSGYRMRGAKKGPGSRLQNIRKTKRFRNIYISDRCPNTIRELTSLTYATDKDGHIIPDEFNMDPHTYEAIWYALEFYEVADLKERKNFSGLGGRM